MKQIPYHCHGFEKKSLEIYTFIDPLCAECWALEPILKKLMIEYGPYFSLKYILSGQIARLNLSRKQDYEHIAEIWERTASRTGMSCDGNLWFENPISSPHLASVAIKAAELQGRKAGIRFLRKIRERLFLSKQNISDVDVLKDCAEEVGLDVDEFISDLYSTGAAKAFQCDLKITAEMEVDEIPTLVFFNENIEEEGLKITGIYPYEVYEQIINEMLPYPPEKLAPPPMEQFIEYFKVVATKEIAIVYNMSDQETEKEMKKLQLMQIVEQLPAKHGTFWKYIKSEKKKMSL